MGSIIKGRGGGRGQWIASITNLWVRRDPDDLLRRPRPTFVYFGESKAEKKLLKRLVTHKNYIHTHREHT